MILLSRKAGKRFTFPIAASIIVYMNKLLYLRRDPIGAAAIFFMFFIGLTGLPYMQAGEWFSSDAREASLYGLTLCRAAAAAVMYFFCLQTGLGGRAQGGAARGKLLLLLPALLVAVNNAPVIAFCRRTAGVTAGADLIVLFALQCICVGMFEEITFRGILLPLLMESSGGESGKWIAVLVSSALFGLTHFFNLFSGASVGAVVLQAGYSFLIGAMFCVIMFCTGKLWACAGLHALFNFGGTLSGTLGYGALRDIWNLPTVVITAAIGVFAIVFYLIAFIRGDGAVLYRRCRLTLGQRFAMNF